MDNSNGPLTPIALDAQALCDAFWVVTNRHNLSVAELSRETGYPEQNLHRMMRYQEPRLSQLANVERIMRWGRGEIVREAGLVQLPLTTEEMIATDPRLLPELQELGLATFNLWLKASR